MSGILERMAKRALGALPTVQPLTAPHIAPADRRLYPRPLDLETHLAMDAPASRTEPVHTLVQQAEDDWAQPEVGRRRTIEDIHVPRTLEDEEGPARVHDRGSQDRVQPLKPVPGERVAEGRANARTNVVTNWIVSEKPAQKPERIDIGLHQAAEFGKPSMPMGTGENLVLDTQDDPGDVTAEIGKRSLTPNKREDSGWKDHTVLVPAQHFEQAATVSGRDRRQSVSPAPSVEQKTEIHVSIGTIELRAPRAETKPLAAPFQPRVTLEDFLRRKLEA
jgi:hypothetical protein